MKQNPLRPNLDIVLRV